MRRVVAVLERNRFRFRRARGGLVGQRGLHQPRRLFGVLGRLHEHDGRAQPFRLFKLLVDVLEGLAHHVVRAR